MAIEDLSQRLLPIVQEAGFNITPERMLRITPLIRERIKLLRDVLTAADFFFVDQLPPYDPAELIPQKGDAAMAKRVLEKAQDVLANVEFKHDPLDHALRAAAQELGIKAGQMFQPIRVAVCGRKNAPPLFETLEVLGRDTTLVRIEQARDKMNLKQQDKTPNRRRLGAVNLSSYTSIIKCAIAKSRLLRSLGEPPCPKTLRQLPYQRPREAVDPAGLEPAPSNWTG